MFCQYFMFDNGFLLSRGLSNSCRYTIAVVRSPKMVSLKFITSNSATPNVKFGSSLCQTLQE